MIGYLIPLTTKFSDPKKLDRYGVYKEHPEVWNSNCLSESLGVEDIIIPTFFHSSYQTHAYILNALVREPGSHRMLNAFLQTG